MIVLLLFLQKQNLVDCTNERAPHGAVSDVTRGTSAQSRSSSSFTRAKRAQMSFLIDSSSARESVRATRKFMSSSRQPLLADNWLATHSSSICLMSSSAKAKDSAYDSLGFVSASANSPNYSLPAMDPSLLTTFLELDRRKTEMRRKCSEHNQRAICTILGDTGATTLLQSLKNVYIFTRKKCIHFWVSIVKNVYTLLQS